jgi:hypothetical protein
LEKPGNDTTVERDVSEENSGCRLIRNAKCTSTARERLNGTPGGKDFDDPKVLVMIIVVAVVGLLILMPLARVLGTRGAKTPA